MEEAFALDLEDALSTSELFFVVDLFMLLGFRVLVGARLLLAIVVSHSALALSDNVMFDQRLLIYNIGSRAVPGLCGRG